MKFVSAIGDIVLFGVLALQIVFPPSPWAGIIGLYPFAVVAAPMRFIRAPIRPASSTLPSRA